MNFSSYSWSISIQNAFDHFFFFGIRRKKTTRNANKNRIPDHVILEWLAVVRFDFIAKTTIRWLISKNCFNFKVTMPKMIDRPATVNLFRIRKFFIFFRVFVFVQSVWMNAAQLLLYVLIIFYSVVPLFSKFYGQHKTFPHSTKCWHNENVVNFLQSKQMSWAVFILKMCPDFFLFRFARQKIIVCIFNWSSVGN